MHSVANIFKPLATAGDQEFNVALLVLWVCLAIFIVVVSLLTYALIRFRRRRDDDNQEPPQVYGSFQIEAAWTVIPILIVFVLTMVAARVIAGVEDAPPPKNAIHATVIGHQWWWEVRYPDLGITTANEISMPGGPGVTQPTYLSLGSADVIHSFWIPQLGGKVDLIPNRINQMWFDPRETGTFLGNCAEYCGTQHANMLLRVVVRPPAEFQQWAASEKQNAVAEPSVATQRATYESLSCVNCHAIQGTVSKGKFGPDLTHMMSRRTIASGMVPNTRENLRAWLKDPQELKPGALMPNMQLTDSQLDAVVAYLSTLK